MEKIEIIMVFLYSGFTAKMNLLKHEQFPVDIGSKQFCINVGASRESSHPSNREEASVSAMDKDWPEEA